MTPSAYGDVVVALDGEDYTVRCGNREFKLAEEALGVKGVLACLMAANASIQASITFCRICLSRLHPSLTEEQVADLKDYRPVDGGPTLEQALEAAIKFAYPKLFPGEEGADPKATAATTQSKE